MVQADAKGHVFLLRAKTLEVFPLDAAGRLGKPTLLGKTSEPMDPPTTAAMSSDGSRWALLAGAEVWLASGGDLRPAPSTHWLPTNVSFVETTPVATVLPIRLASPTDEFWSPPTKAPLLPRLSDDTWETILEEGDMPSPLEQMRDRMLITDRRLLAMAPASDGKLWLANRYFYRIRRTSKSGKVSADLAGDTRLHEIEGAAKVQQSFERATARPGEPKGATQATANTMRPILLGVAEGSDGNLYAVADDRGGLTLDRYNPVLEIVERSRLGLEYHGQYTMASGTDGLYLAPYTGAGGRWRIPWEDLEGADWHEVPGVKLGGPEKTTR